MSDPTERDSRMSSTSKISRSSNQGSTKRIEEGDGSNKKISDETIFEEEESEAEKVPSITYSRSVSDIEEYESDLFDLGSDELARKDNSTYSQASDNSKGDFSLPRANGSRLTLTSDVHDYNEQKKDIKDQNDEDDETNICSQNNEITDEDNKILTGSKTDSDANNEPTEKYDSDEEIDLFTNKNLSVNKSVEELAQDAIGIGSLDTGKTKQDTKSEESNKENGHGVEKDSQKNNGECHKTGDENDSCSEGNEKTAMQFAIKNNIVTYQQLRKKDKKLLTRKERMEIFKRSSLSNNGRRKLRKRGPDREIPSYKAKFEKERQKYEAVKAVLDEVIEKSTNVVERRNNKEMVMSLLEDVLENAEIEAAKRAKERKGLEMANGIIDDILDIWESKIDANNLIQNEIDLNRFCSSIVHGALIVAARDVAGVAPYHVKHKTPLYKAVDNGKGTMTRKKKLISKKHRQALRDAKQRATLSRGSQNNNRGEESKDEGLEKEDKGKHGTGKKPTETMEHVERKPVLLKKNSHDSSTREKQDVEMEETMKRNNAIYIEAEDDISCGFSASITVKKEETSKEKGNYEKGEEELEQVEGRQLQKMENERGENSVILNNLPNSEKGDYCFQWIMNYGRIPKPPLENVAKKRSIDTRKRRFARKVATKKERTESEASVQVSIRKYPVLQPIAAPSLAESGASFIRSGRESELTMKSDVTLASNNSRRNKTNDDSVDANDINGIKEHFENIMKMKIYDKYMKMREKEEEEEERRVDNEEKWNGFIQNEEDKNSEGSNKFPTEVDRNEEVWNGFIQNKEDNISEGSNKLSTEVDHQSISETSCRSEAKLNEYKKQNNIYEDDTTESILPCESESGEEGERERFHTPDSEIIECKTKQECNEEMNKERKRKIWVWPPKSIIKWRHFTAGKQSTYV